MSEELLGPKKSREAIDMLEDWLKKNCKKPMAVDKIKATWQYLTGHEPRKIVQYLLAIEAGGKIELLRNNGERHCVWIGEQSDTSFTDYAREKEAEKARPKLTLAEIIDKKIKEAADIKAKMKSGPCKGNECPPFTENSCEHCSGFLNLKDKKFLEE